MDLSLKNIELVDFKKVYYRIKKDFALGEYAPYEVLYQQLKGDIQQGQILFDGKKEVAYSICTEGSQDEYALISLFAVYEEYRGSGYGTAFLEEIIKFYSEKKGIIVEVEKPENAKTESEMNLRLKRIQFYQKAGFCMVPDVDYSIWDVPMHLMVLPLKASCKEIFGILDHIMYEIYFKLMGKRYIHKMHFASLT